MALTTAWGARRPDPGNRPRRRLGCALLALAVLAGAAPAAAQQKGGGPQTVIVAAAERVDFADKIEALGTTRSNESVQITTSVAEKIAEIAFDDGQRVEAGQVLIVLDRAEELAALRSAEAAVSERRSAFARTEQLAERNFAAKATLDETRAALQQAEAAVAVARSRLADREIRAPFDGVTGLRTVSVGSLVEPGDPITTLDDLSVIKLDFSVPATFLAALVPGLKIVARTSALPGRDFEGTIRSVATQVDPVTRSVVARAILPNPDGALRPGLLMTVTLFKNPRRAVVVPEGALVPEGERNFVFVVAGGEGPTAVKRTVKIGARRPGEVEILDGLEDGELVVAHGATRLRDGQAVEILGREGEPVDAILRKSSGS